MKKTFFAFALVMLALTSCKKDYSCTCTDTEVYDGQTDSYTYNYKVEGATKKEAQAACIEATITQIDGNDSYKTKCELSK